MRARHHTALLLVTSLSLSTGCDDATSTQADASNGSQEELDATVTESADADATPSSNHTTAEVGVAGATLELDTLVLIIPPGAVAETIDVTLRSNTQGSEVPSDAYSKRYDIEPQTLTLELNATIELEVSGTPRYPVLVLHTPGQPPSLIQGEVTNGVFRAELASFGSVYLADAAELSQSEEFADNVIVIELVGQGGSDAGPGVDAEAADSSIDAATTANDDGGDSTPESTSAESTSSGTETSSTQTDTTTSNEQNSSSITDAGSSADADVPVVVPIEPGVVPPQGYLGAATSPFAGITFDYFYLEDFEDHDLNQPGVTATAYQMSSSFSTSVIDSVDGDDGNPSDNQCVKVDTYCDALWASQTVTFTFDPEALGGYPTHAGAVWTDGEGLVGFEAFGLQGEVIYSVEPFSEPGFPGVGITSDTAEDRFFGVYSPQGVSAIRIYNTSGGIEVDHLQYGRQSPSTAPDASVP